MLKRALIIGLGSVVVIFALAIIFGGPGTPHPMGSITDPFNSVDCSDSWLIGHQLQHAPDGQGIERGRIYDLCAGSPWPWWFRRQGPDRLYRTIGRRSH